MLIAITGTFALMLSLNTHSYAFHENLGIDDNKASELYRTNPNDPAIVQWKSALQSAINDMGECFDIEQAISCQFLITTIISNCKSHPNTLLACNDARLAQYPLILQQAKEEQRKAEEEQRKAEEEQKKAEEEQKDIEEKERLQYEEYLIENAMNNTNFNNCLNQNMSVVLCYDTYIGNRPIQR